MTVRIGHNLKLLAQHDAGGAPNLGEGIAITIMPDGRRILYVAHEYQPAAFSIFDVTEPRDPKLVWQLPVPHRNVRGNSLALWGDTLLMAYQVNQPGLKPAGFQVYDVSDPVAPREVTFFDVSGPHSRGVHRVSFLDGRYAHIATGAPDFEPDNPKDYQFYMIVDLEDRSKPREVGRWWMPGQRKGDTASLPPRHPKPFDHGYRPHHTLCYPERPDRAYLGYIDGGIVILDIADKADPKMISCLDYSPPFPGWTHTVHPLFERDLLVVTDEATLEHEGSDWPKRVWIVDVRSESNPIIIASLPTPDGFEEMRRSGGRIGAHNIHENRTTPGAAFLQNTVVATWFTAGLRIYDLADPYRPEEIAAFLPETPTGQKACRISDVFVDDRGIVYATDRTRGGLYVLEYTGKHPLN